MIVTINQPGWYRVSPTDLVDAGLDPDIDPRHLCLFVQGVEQSLHVQGESDGHLDTGDVLEFYAEGLDTPWTDTQRYWLVLGTRPGLRMRQVESHGPPPLGVLAFPSTVTHRERAIYVAAVRNGAAENFFGAVLRDQPVDQHLLLHHLAPEAPGDGQLAIALQGMSPEPHDIQVKLNGYDVGTVTIQAQTHHRATFAIPQRWLQPEANVITLHPFQPEITLSLVDQIQLTYWRTYTAHQDQLRSTATATQSIALKGFTDATIRVFDITAPAAVAELLGPITQHGETYRITVTPTGTGQRILLALTDVQALRPQSLEAHTPLTWHLPGHGADLLILTHQRFFDSLVPLQIHRETQGWSVALIDVQDLYDTWNSGTKDPGAITDFVRHTTRHWRPAPRFVLLAGDASFDPRDYLHTGPSDWLPTQWVETAQMETASDDPLVDLNRDGHADLAIGRLPVRSAAEAEAMVAKLIAHDQAIDERFNRSLVIMAAPDDFNFVGATQPLLRKLREATSITPLKLGELPFVEARNQLQTHLQAGQQLVTYLGHGSVQRWHPEGLLTAQDARQLTNGPRLPLVLSMTCLSGFSHGIYNQSLAEELIRNPFGGAIAVWASTGLTRPAGQTEMQQVLLDVLLRPERPTLGEAIQAAKAATTDLDVRLTWLFLGDPTQRWP